MIIEMNDETLPPMDNPLQLLAWRNAYDHGFRTLSRRHKLDPVTANSLAEEYAQRHWRNWLSGNDAPPPLVFQEDASWDRLSLA